MVRRTVRLCALILPFLVAPSLAQTAPETPGALSPRRFEIRRASSAIQVDGVLDEAAWSDALTYDLPYEWFPGDNVPPPVRTDFLVTYDDANLYAAWKAHDPAPAEIRAHLMDRDSIDTFIQDDHVVLMIDTFNDERRGFQFRINPLGVQADAVFSQNEGIEDFSFDMIWASAAKIDEDGYVIEVAIPLNQIRFPGTTGPQTWGFDVGRSYPRSVRHRMLAWPRDRANSCLLCQVDKVTGFAGIEPGRNLEITPTLTANRTDVAPADAPGELATGDEEVEPGISARWGITPNLSLNAAINPDFSQVEADAAQLSVNERFALFFPEKRPFFLEGIDFFATPIQAVFTRTVVDPRWGLKMTGKEGKNGFGVFVAEDEDNALTLPFNDRSIPVFLQGEQVTSGVVRYRRDIGTGSTVGVLLTGREGDDYHNHVAGLDGFFRLSDTDTTRVQILSSDTLDPTGIARPAGEAFSGEALLADYRHDGRDWAWSLAYEDRAPEFRADSGFVPRVDFREGRGSVQRQIWGDQDNWFTRINVGLTSRRTEDHSGQLTDERIQLYSNLSGPLQSFFEVGLGRNKESFQGVLYEDLDRLNFLALAQPSGVAQISLFGDFGETVDFSNNQPADVFV
ncbi:MAG TPA: DUF5916 domain-containing protein, partial [Thermoanaerobaculia bacterium]|nr:DUF5916 domain-containing protein [Thermoanaerobaculia bacterium]